VDQLVDQPRARLTVGTEPGGGLRLHLGGELDIASLPDVEAALTGVLTREPQPLQLDLADLDFLDSSGVAVLIRLANRFAPVRTTHTTEPVRRVLEALGLADHLGVNGA
jgi:anti-sigma B factor antagonist